MKRSSNRSVATRLRALLLTAGLVLAGVVGVASPASASAPILLSGSEWLGGDGVNVCTNNNGGGSDPSCGGEVQIGNVTGAYWQCVELAQRLYTARGWHSGIFSGVPYGAYQIYDAYAANGMTRQANGSITSLVPGDMIVHGTNEPYSGGAGHVSIVDHVSGSTVYAVSQNTYNDQPVGTYAFSSGTLTKSGSGTIRGVVHDPNNTSGNSSGTWGGVKGASFLGDHHLVNGQQMHSNQYIMSDDGRFVLLMQTDGNLVEYTASGSLWASNTAGHPGAYLGMQSDGNVVIYSSGGTALWSTGPKGIQVLKIQTDGNLVARNSAGTAKWANNIVQDTLGLTYKGDNHLNNGQTLVKKEYLRSSDRRYTVVMHSDGRLNVYAPGWRRIWTSNSGGHANAYLGMQSDGNVVVYTSDGAVWATGPKGIQVLKIQDDGNLVARNSAGTAVWATNTNGKL